MSMHVGDGELFEGDEKEEEVKLEVDDEEDEDVQLDLGRAPPLLLDEWDWSDSTTSFSDFAAFDEAGSWNCDSTEPTQAAATPGSASNSTWTLPDDTVVFPYSSSSSEEQQPSVCVPQLPAAAHHHGGGAPGPPTPSPPQANGDWTTAYDALREGSSAPHRPRPPLLRGVATRQQFLERPPVRRLAGCDRWQNSGGRKGSTDFWVDENFGLRKRYGRVQRQDRESLRFVQYSLLRNKANPVENRSAVFYSVGGTLDGIDEPPVSSFSPVKRQKRLAPPPGGNVGARQPPGPQTGQAEHHVRHRHNHGSRQPQLSRPQIEPQVGGEPEGDGQRAPVADPGAFVMQKTARSGEGAVLDLRARRSDSTFISFQDDSGSEWRDQSDQAGFELGAIVRATHGIKLESPTGDFAEWHRRCPQDKPFEEGDVVGFRHGKLSRKTGGCTMFGVITRQAVVEGSAPPVKQRHLYDTVAYCGVVPIKVWSPSVHACHRELGGTAGLRAQSGDILAPSGREDGTAVVIPASTCITAPRVGVVLDACTLNADTSVNNQEQHLVMSVVVPPSETSGHSIFRSLLVGGGGVLFLISFTLMMSFLMWSQLMRAPGPLPHAGGSVHSRADITGNVHCSGTQQKIILSVYAGVHSGVHWADSGAANVTLEGLQWQVSHAAPHHRTIIVSKARDFPDVYEFRGAFCAVPGECYDVDIDLTDQAYTHLADQVFHTLGIDPDTFPASDDEYNAWATTVQAHVRSWGIVWTLQKQTASTTILPIGGDHTLTFPPAIDRTASNTCGSRAPECTGSPSNTLFFGVDFLDECSVALRYLACHLDSDRCELSSWVQLVAISGIPLDMLLAVSKEHCGMDFVGPADGMVGRFAEDISGVLRLAGVDDTTFASDQRINITVFCPASSPGCPSSGTRQVCHGRCEVSALYSDMLHMVVHWQWRAAYEYRYAQDSTVEMRGGMYSTWISAATHAQTDTATGFTKLSCGFLPDLAGSQVQGAQPTDHAGGSASSSSSSSSSTPVSVSVKSVATLQPAVASASWHIPRASRSWAWTGDLQLLPWVDESVPPSHSPAQSDAVDFAGCNHYSDCLSCSLAGCGWCLKQKTCQYGAVGSSRSCGNGTPEEYVGGAGGGGASGCPAPDTTRMTAKAAALVHERSRILAFERADSRESSSMPAGADDGNSASCTDNLQLPNPDNQTEQLSCADLFQSTESGFEICDCDATRVDDRIPLSAGTISDVCCATCAQAPTTHEFSRSVGLFAAEMGQTFTVSISLGRAGSALAVVIYSYSNGTRSANASASHSNPNATGSSDGMDWNAHVPLRRAKRELYRTTSRSGCSKDTFGIVKCPNPDYVYGLWTAPSSQSEGASSDGVYFIEVMPDTNGGDALPCGWSFTGSFALAMEPVEK